MLSWLQQQLRVCWAVRSRCSTQQGPGTDTGHFATTQPGAPPGEPEGREWPVICGGPPTAGTEPPCVWACDGSDWKSCRQEVAC